LSSSRSSARAIKSTVRPEETVDDIIVPYKNAIESELAELTKTQSAISKMLGEVLRPGGKRLRPVIALMVCDAVCGDYKRALPVAVSYELAHSASLVQDDIIDESSVRHERETLHKKYGTVRAIMASDLLLFEIFQVLSKYGRSELSIERLAMILSTLADAAKKTAEGEMLDSTLVTKPHPTVEDYLQVAGLKTGALFAAVAASGAIAGGANEVIVNAMSEFGMNVGISFQIRDDILDIFGNSQKLGKPVLKDIQNSASNIVLIHALSNADPYKRHVINSMMYKKWFAKTEVDQLLATLKESGSIENAQSLSRRHIGTARELLLSLPDNEPRRKLSKLTQTLESVKV
jgi:geranylgeranyl diphosphate synthase type II